jgi:transcriptional regulator with XRE-family HTH domain
VWKERQGVSYNEMGRRMGITGVRVSNLCHGDRMPTHRHAQLIAIGVPRELLPEPLDVKPGPKPRHIASLHEEFESAFKG